MNSIIFPSKTINSHKTVKLRLGQKHFLTSIHFGSLILKHLTYSGRVSGREIILGWREKNTAVGYWVPAQGTKSRGYRDSNGRRQPMVRIYIV